MKALRTKISTYAIALLVSIGFATPTLAGSSDFSGIFIAGHAELNVVAIDGTHTMAVVITEPLLLKVQSEDLLQLQDGKQDLIFH